MLDDGSFCSWLVGESSFMSSSLVIVVSMSGNLTMKFR